MSLDASSRSAVLAALKSAMPALQMVPLLAMSADMSNKSTDPPTHLISTTIPTTATTVHGVRPTRTHGILSNGMSQAYTGMYFFYAYASLASDTTFTPFADRNIQLALGQYGNYISFLDNVSAAGGRWNDDIGWWGIAMVTAAEGNVNGVVAPGTAGFTPRYLDVASATHAEMYENWDDGCDGGIFWSRDRNAPKENDRYYKSSISNAQHLELGARLFALTGDTNYRLIADRVYTFMQKHLIDPATYDITDGIDNRDCSKSQWQFSYTTAEVLAAHASLYKTTRETRYLDEAHKHFNHIVTNFLQSNILTDPICGADSDCKDPTGFLWPVYKALAVLYTVTPDANIKSQIVSIMQTSSNFVFRTCNENWNYTDYTLSDGTNVRDQFETVAMLLALAVMTSSQPLPPLPSPVSSQVQVETTQPQQKQSAATAKSSVTANTAAVDASQTAPPSTANVGLIAGIVTVVILLAALAAVGYWYWFIYRKKQMDSSEGFEQRDKLSDYKPNKPFHDRHSSLAPPVPAQRVRRPTRRDTSSIQTPTTPTQLSPDRRRNRATSLSVSPPPARARTRNPDRDVSPAVESPRRNPSRSRTDREPVTTRHNDRSNRQQDRSESRDRQEISPVRQRSRREQEDSRDYERRNDARREERIPRKQSSERRNRSSSIGPDENTRRRQREPEDSHEVPSRRGGEPERNRNKRDVSRDREDRSRSQGRRDDGDDRRDRSRSQSTRTRTEDRQDRNRGDRQRR
ncbi:hydrolase 76 protein [Chytriomyces hyalinus]|nr:hydrolase 76 protein [Chytriomyces hyalinus]